VSLAYDRRTELDGLGAPGLDVTAYLTGWFVLLFGISAFQVVPGFGAVGSPALLVALSTLALWLAGWLMPSSDIGTGRHPMRVALVGYLSLALLSYAVAMSRPVSALEMTGALRALIMSLAVTGIGLLVADGVRDRARLDVLLRRAVVGVAFVSLLGITQFLSGRQLQPLLPGLVWNTEVVGVGVRSIFNRPSSTAMHPIELSVITASMLPLGIHFALYSETLRMRRNMATATVIIAFAMPLAVSRSGILSVIVGLVVLAAGWGWRRRLNGLLIAAGAIPVLWALVPGLVGTFISLFGNAAYDPSIQGRIERGPLVMAQVRERPWLGLGSGTWSVEEYFLLDNQIWATMLETGLLGLAVVVILLLIGIGSGLVAARMPTLDRSSAHLGQALAASIAALSISALTFDAFFYRILTGLLFLLLGAVGALWRLEHVSEVLFRREGPASSERGSALRLPPPPAT
jgi:polysaccharide biosynthesis protein PslJ